MNIFCVLNLNRDNELVYFTANDNDTPLLLLHLCFLLWIEIVNKQTIARKNNNKNPEFIACLFRKKSKKGLLVLLKI